MSSNFRIIVQIYEKAGGIQTTRFLFGVNAKSHLRKRTRCGQESRRRRYSASGSQGSPQASATPVDHFALHDVEPQFQFAVFLAGTAPALVGELDDVGKRGVGERKRRGIGHGAGMLATQ